MKFGSLDSILVIIVTILAVTDYLMPGRNGTAPLGTLHTYVGEKFRTMGHADAPTVLQTPDSQNQGQKISMDDHDKAGIRAHLKQAKTFHPASLRDPELHSIEHFLNWSRIYGIKLVGVSKPVNDFYYNGARKDDFLAVDDVPNILEVAHGLYKLPEDLLKAMRGKTLYLSHISGRGYTVLGTWPDQGILVNVDRGSFLEQPITPLQTIHEFAHILDFHGIQGLYHDKNNHWAHLKDARNELFEVPFPYDPNLPGAPAGFMDVYSTANPAENFAQHFTFYILQGPQFRKEARDDILLQKKYDFFRQNLFRNREY